ncbi:MAG: glycosyltransferase family 2 protein [Bacilli bacterium]|nr:glycosyltransferase family 2 protein [Bacilli bacterium]
MTDLTIIVPLYNHEKELIRCLDSLVKSIDDKMLILVVDDGSTDNGYKLGKEYAKNNKLVKVIHKENGGLCSARNFGIEHSNSKYITFCDPDDAVNNNYKYRELIDKIDEGNYDYLIFNFSYNKNNIITPNTKFPKTNKVLQSKEDIMYLQASTLVGNINNLNIDFFDGCSYTWSKIYKSSIIKQNKLLFNTNLKFSEDSLYNFIYISYINKAVIMDKKLYNYYVYDTNTTNRYKNNIADDYDIYNNEISYLKNSNNPILMNAYYARMLRNLTNILRYCTFHKDNPKKGNIKSVLEKYPYYKESIKKAKYKYLSKKQKIILFLFKIRFYKTIELVFKL